MLILKRRSAEQVVLDEHSRVTIVSTSVDTVKLKVTVPADICIERVDTSESLDCEAVLVPSGDTVIP